MWHIKSFITEWKIKGAKKRSLMLFGAFFLLCAIAGVFIPIIPQVPFAIMSAYFFSKGSTVIHLAIRHNKFFGKPVRNWEDFKVIEPKMKIIATISIIAGAIMGHYKLQNQWAYSLDAVSALAVIFVLTRKSKVTAII